MSLHQHKAELYRHSDAILSRAESAKRPLSNEEAHAVASDTALLDVCTTVDNHSAILRSITEQKAQIPTAFPFRSFGEQLLAIRRSAVDHQEDPRLRQVVRALGSNEIVGSDGGFLAQPDFSADLWTRVYQTGEVVRRCTRFPLTKRGIRIPAIDETSRADGARFGGILARWTKEGDQISTDRPRFRMNDLETSKLVVAVPVTDELMQDVPALETFVARLAALEINFKLELSILRGDGAGECLGVLDSDATIVVTKQNGQAAGTLTAQNIADMWSRLWVGARRDAVWIVNQQIESQLYTLSLTIGDGGGPIFQPAGVAGSPFATLFGKPVIPVECLPGPGGSGDIVLANLRDYLVADRGIEGVPSIHVRFLTDEMVFRFTLRVNGQPADASPLTPYGGGPTVSSFVCLETRS